MVPPSRATPSAGAPEAAVVTDNVEPMAVRMATMSWMMYLIVSFFIGNRSPPLIPPRGEAVTGAWADG